MPNYEAATQLWEILVPTHMTVPGDRLDMLHEIDSGYHRRWDQQVREIAGGLTILRSALGYWEDPQKGQLHQERMIPVRIACTGDQIERIADLTADHYRQDAIMYYKLSDEVKIKHYR